MVIFGKRISWKIKLGKFGNRAKTCWGLIRFSCYIFFWHRLLKKLTSRVSCNNDQKLRKDDFQLHRSSHHNLPSNGLKTFLNINRRTNNNQKPTFERRYVICNHSWHSTQPRLLADSERWQLPFESKLFKNLYKNFGVQCLRFWWELLTFSIFDKFYRSPHQQVLHVCFSPNQQVLKLNSESQL